MKLLGVYVLAVVLLAAAILAAPAQALPEYAVQTGEACATCHISPSGGGLRAPRGQAWVAAAKPGAVPDLVQALEALGVHRQVDPRDYQAAPGMISVARPPELKAGQAARYERVLREHQGN